MRSLDVDIDTLLAAFEYNTDEVDYYLDLETGRVVMIGEEIQWELEAMYEEFYDPDADEDFDLKHVLQQRGLPEWRQHALLQADEVEEYYIRRYIDVPASDVTAAYGDLQAFTNTVDDKELRQDLWRAISGSGAFGKFKHILRNHPEQRERWATFSNRRARKRVLDWLAEQEIQLPLPAKASEEDTSSRKRLIDEVLTFTRAAAKLPGVLRIALIGSLATHKADPKDADILVTIEEDLDLEDLAALGRKLQGHTQSFSRSGDVFLADAENNYLGRTCPWKQCEAGLHADCDALHCGARPYLHDDLHTIRLSTSLIAAPPIELWPDIITRISPPDDVKFGLIAPLRAEKP